MAIDPKRVPRFGHGSRVPGWDDAADLEKDPQQVPDATTPVPDELRARILFHMSKYPDFRSASIPALHEVQRMYGWCTPEGIVQAAAVMRLTPAYLTSVASFYDMLFLEPAAANQVFVCTNISCSLCGADELHEAFRREVGDDPDVDVRPFECLGACDIAPMASINGQYVGPITIDEVPTVVEQIRNGQEPLPEKQLSRRKSVDPKADQQ